MLPNIIIPFLNRWDATFSFGFLMPCVSVCECMCVCVCVHVCVHNTIMSFRSSLNQFYNEICSYLNNLIETFNAPLITNFKFS